MGADIQAKLQKVTDSEGCDYYGEVKNDKPHGNGQYSCKDGRQYFGEWANGKMHGNGRLIWREGHYNGTFVKGEFHGFGKRVDYGVSETCVSESQY